MILADRWGFGWISYRCKLFPMAEATGVGVQHQGIVGVDLHGALDCRFRGTPSFLVNDQLLVIPHTFEYWQSLIEPILSSNN